MMGVRLVLLVALSLTLLIGATQVSRADAAYCVRTYFENGGNANVLGIASDEVTQLLAKLEALSGLSNDIVPFPCDAADKAESTYLDASSGLVPGEYIAYNPVWVREVIGNNRAEAIVLFGHELGHLINRHFTTGRSKLRLQKELEADRFAGCIAARMDVSWTDVSGILSRIRDEYDTSYPSRIHSLEVAKAGYDTCKGAEAPAAAGSRVKISVELYDDPYDGKVIDEVPVGTIVQVGECRDNDMCNINGEGYSGWIYDGPDYDTLDGRP